MQIKKSSPTHLTLADQPGCFWIFGFFFLLIGGVVVAGLLGLFTNLKEVSLYRLTMRLRSGEEVELSWLWLHGKDKLEKVAERARIYLEENPE